MQVRMDKRVAALMDAYQNNPKSIQSPVIADLLKERQNMSLKEGKFVNDMKEIQDGIAKQLAEKGNELTKLRGAIDYVEGKILEEYQKSLVEKSE